MVLYVIDTYFSPGYMLADAGYDVWLGNLRGTQYSMHKERPRNEAKFWEFR